MNLILNMVFTMVIIVVVIVVLATKVGNAFTLIFELWISKLTPTAVLTLVCHVMVAVVFLMMMPLPTLCRYN